MTIHEIHIENFRGFEEFNQSFNPNFNVIVGVNGVGKTALLEALCVSIGSFFLGIDGAESKSIRVEDIFFRIGIEGYDLQTPVVIKTEGTVLGNRLLWSRERFKENINGTTTYGNARE